MDERPGFLVPEPVATLVLDRPPFVGAEIKVRLRLSPTLYFAGKDVIGRISAPDSTVDQMMEMSREASALFAEFGLISWNVLDPQTSKPVPATLDGLNSLDIRITNAIISTWIAWLGRAPLPLPETSPEPTALPTGRNRKRRSSTAGPSTAATSRKRSTPPTSLSSSESAA